MEVADCVKMKPPVPKPLVTVTRTNEVLNRFDATSEEEEEANSFCFLMKVPRCDDLQGEIDLAKLELDEKSRLADAIQVQVQEKRANIRVHELDYENAKHEDRKARSSMKPLRVEINSLMYVISRGNDALSVEDINTQLKKMEHIIQHETLSSKREKKIFKESNQLKKSREELLAFLGSQDEIEQALEERDEAEGRLKIVRKELDILKDVVVKAEAASVEAQKKCDSENRNMKELQAKFRAANCVRQSAYGQWQSLKKELSEKNKHFFQYKDDAAAAKRCASSGNKKALSHLCTNQVEKLMQLWNTNVEFRQEYVKSNVRSTIRRLGTLDGRSLGPGEKPHDIPAPQERVDRMMMMMTKKSTPAPTVEATKSKQESESTKKAEEMLREDNEAKMKEQRRLEEMAKAEVEAQKKEEEKEKARQKRLRKKEKQKAKKAKAKAEAEAEAEAAMDAHDMINICETAVKSSNEDEDVELPEKPQRQLTRTIYIVPTPPLRSRDLRRYQQLKWTGLMSFFISVMFLFRIIHRTLDW